MDNMDGVESFASSIEEIAMHHTQTKRISFPNLNGSSKNELMLAGFLNDQVQNFQSIPSSNFPISSGADIIEMRSISMPPRDNDNSLPFSNEAIIESSFSEKKNTACSLISSECELELPGSAVSQSTILLDRRSECKEYATWLRDSSFRIQLEKEVAIWDQSTQREQNLLGRMKSFLSLLKESTINDETLVNLFISVREEITQFFFWKMQSSSALDNNREAPEPLKVIEEERVSSEFSLTLVQQPPNIVFLGQKITPSPIVLISLQTIPIHWSISENFSLSVGVVVSREEHDWLPVAQSGMRRIIVESSVLFQSPSLTSSSFTTISLEDIRVEELSSSSSGSFFLWIVLEESIGARRRIISSIKSSSFQVIPATETLSNLNDKLSEDQYNRTESNESTISFPLPFHSIAPVLISSIIDTTATLPAPSTHRSSSIFSSCNDKKDNDSGCCSGIISQLEDSTDKHSSNNNHNNINGNDHTCTNECNRKPECIDLQSNILLTNNECSKEKCPLSISHIIDTPAKTTGFSNGAVLQDITMFLSLSQKEAAQHLGISESMLCKRFKEVTRRKWPYRYLQKLDKLIENYRHLERNGITLRKNEKEKLASLLLERAECLKPVQIRISSYDRICSRNLLNNNPENNPENDPEDHTCLLRTKRRPQQQQQQKQHHFHHRQSQQCREYSSSSSVTTSNSMDSISNESTNSNDNGIATDGNQEATGSFLVACLGSPDTIPLSGSSSSLSSLSPSIPGSEEEQSVIEEDQEAPFHNRKRSTLSKDRHKRKAIKEDENNHRNPIQITGSTGDRWSLRSKRKAKVNERKRNSSSSRLLESNLPNTISNSGQEKSKLSLISKEEKESFDDSFAVETLGMLKRNGYL